MKEKITSFTDLKAWQKAHELVLLIYKIVSKFPAKEKFILSSQMLRAAISISSNIAEGFARNSAKEKIQFYYIARGSLVELQNQLLITKDLKYIDRSLFETVAQKTIEVHKLINGLIRSLRS